MKNFLASLLVAASLMFGSSVFAQDASKEANTVPIFVVKHIEADDAIAQKILAGVEKDLGEAGGVFHEVSKDEDLPAGLGINFISIRVADTDVLFVEIVLVPDESSRPQHIDTVAGKAKADSIDDAVDVISGFIAQSYVSLATEEAPTVKPGVNPEDDPHIVQDGKRYLISFKKR